MPVSGDHSAADGAHVRLLGANEVALDANQRGHAVGVPDSEEAIELSDLVLVAGDDQLAAPFVRDVMLARRIDTADRGLQRRAALSASPAGSRCRRE